MAMNERTMPMMPSAVRTRPGEPHYPAQVQERAPQRQYDSDEEAMRKLEQAMRAAPLRQIGGIVQHISYGHMMEMATMLEKDKPDVMTPEAIAAWLHRWACEVNGDLS